MSPEPATVTVRPLAFVTADSGTSFAEAERASAATHGYAEGYAAGSVAVAKRARERQIQIERAAFAQSELHATQQRAAMAALKAAADALEARAVPAIEGVDRSLIEASLQLAEAILGHELRDDEHSAKAVLGRIIGMVDPSELRSVRMHPETAAALPEGAAESAGVTVISDAQLTPGDAVADLPQGFIDARITSTLTRCKALLTEGDSR